MQMQAGIKYPVYIDVESTLSPVNLSAKLIGEQISKMFSRPTSLRAGAFPVQQIVSKQMTSISFIDGQDGNEDDTLCAYVTVTLYNITDDARKLAKKYVSTIVKPAVQEVVKCKQQKENTCNCKVVVKSIYNTGQDPDCCENCAKAKDFIINIMGVAVPSFTHVVRYIAYPQQQ